jgi:NAD(P)-dependent dehydrogenase (short-subunit alcohol dehydrogenase family)
VNQAVPDYQTLFNIRGLTAVITGGSGQLGRAMAQCLAQHGVRVAILSLHAETSEKVAGMINAEGGQAVGVACDVLDRGALERTRALVTDTYGPIDILINAAGGNHPNATTSKDVPFFDLDVHAISEVFSTNFTGTFQSCQVFGRDMAEQGHGSIVNITSMSALRPLTRIPAYSAAKAAIANFTQWLAVHMAQEYSPAIRVKTQPRI